MGSPTSHLKEGTNGTPTIAPPAPGAPQTETTPATLPGADAYVYRDGRPDPMRLFVFKPKGWTASDHRPALVFYFGGGWTHGTPAAAEGFALHATSLGWVGITPDYRTKTRFGTSPLESVADSRASFRWVQDHAAELGDRSHEDHRRRPLRRRPRRALDRNRSHAARLRSERSSARETTVSDTSRPKGYTPFRFGENDVALSARQPARRQDAAHAADARRHR